MMRFPDPEVIQPAAFTELVRSALATAWHEAPGDESEAFLLFRRRYLTAVVESLVESIVSDEGELSRDVRARAFRLIADQAFWSAGGDLTVASEFEETALLHRTPGDGPVGVGVQVAPQVLLTAAHCRPTPEVTFGRDAQNASARLPTCAFVDVIATSEGDLGLTRLLDVGRAEVCTLATTEVLEAAGGKGFIVSFDNKRARRRLAVAFEIEEFHLRSTNALSPSCRKMLCAFGEGDSGSPLYVSVAGSNHLAGILRRDVGDSLGITESFTRVDIHADRIREAAAGLSCSTDGEMA